MKKLASDLWSEAGFVVVRPLASRPRDRGHSGSVLPVLGTCYVGGTGYFSTNRSSSRSYSTAVASLATSSGTPPGKYALCTYCLTIRCVLKKLPFSAIAERITSA